MSLIDENGYYNPALTNPDRKPNPVTRAGMADRSAIWNEFEPSQRARPVRNMPPPFTQSVRSAPLTTASPRT